MLDVSVFRLPWRELRADLAAWAAAGLMMVIIYYGFYTPYPATGLKVFIGCIAFGLFSGMISYLNTENRIIDTLADSQPDSQIQSFIPSSIFTVSRKMMILIVTVLCMMALAILMMILLDVWYLIEKRDTPTPDIYWGVFKEIVFTLAVLLGVSLVILKRYSTNIKRTLDLQLAAMDEISRGNLEKQVPVLTSDEFARYAGKTNAMLDGLKERELCKTSFEKYVSSEVSHKILEEGVSPDGELVDATILFCDLRDYTSFVENRNPREVVAFMNRYFAKMERVIRQYDGVVLQFVGDEIEAVFGAPTAIDDHPQKAVSAAIEMRGALERINADRRPKGLSEVHHGIGIHTGTVLAGNVGSVKRMVYAMVGDTVNIASRLQVLNKSCGTDILISSNTRNRLADNRQTYRNLGRHAIRGKKKEVEVYTVD